MYPKVLLQQQTGSICKKPQMSSFWRQGQNEGAFLRPSLPTTAALQVQDFLKALAFIRQHIASESQQIKLSLLATTAVCISGLPLF